MNTNMDMSMKMRMTMRNKNENENYDDGKILIQEKVKIEESDDMLTLYEKTFSLIPDLTIAALNGVFKNNIDLTKSWL